jgi:sugar/nucleoside kinase (ribokinase family)
MSAAQIDVVGIGNAIVDVLSHAEDQALAALGLAKGAMTLIDAADADRLYDKVGPAVEASGGSAANTIAGLASLGGRGAYVGKVRDDVLGRIFAHDLKALGVHFETAPASDGPGTARCLVMVSPDAQRTMATYLGACVSLGPDDVDANLIAAAKATYLEGYLWDPPLAKEAFRKAIGAARGAGRKVALSLSDAFCVDRYRDEFLGLIDGQVDVLFANETELISLFQARDFDDALQQARGRVPMAALTRSAHGSVVLAGNEVHVVDAAPVARVVDTTGAGDLYAAGFLFGLTRDLPPATCGRLGSVAAAEIISHIGARPEAALSTLVAHLL